MTYFRKSNNAARLIMKNNSFILFILHFYFPKGPLQFIMSFSFTYFCKLLFLNISII